MTNVLVVIGFVAVILGFISNLLSFETNRRQFQRLVIKADATHELVNSQHDNIVARVDQLTNTLVEADVPVPSNGKGGVIIASGDKTGDEQ